MAIDNLEELLCRYDGQAYQVALNMLGDRHGDASDAVQDARIAAWQNISQLRGGFEAWYLTIVRNACNRLYKQRQRSVDWVSLDSVEEIIASPLDQLTDRDERSYLQGAIDMLPPQQALAVRMRHLGDHDYAEIAAVTGATEATARSNVRHGLKNLKERIGTVGAIGA